MKTVSDIAESLSEGYGLSKKDAETYTKEVFKSVAAKVAAGEEVSINGFGKFSVGERAAREGRNPLTGQALHIAASKGVKFKAAKQFKDAL